MAEELANYKLQLHQVEAALLGDPSNDELLKLKIDLMEIINLQEEIVHTEKSSVEPSAPSKPQLWSVGDRVSAPLPTGNRAVAIINNISSAGYAITFITSGQKTIVDPSDLGVAPHSDKKYLFDNGKAGKPSTSNSNRKESQAERERRRLKAQKKEKKRQDLDNMKEAEKSSWQKFNAKGAKKGLHGLRRIPASLAAQDTAARKEMQISSRSNNFSFKSTRGAMDSLF